MWSSETPSTSFETGSLADLELTRRASQKTQEICLSPRPQHWNYHHRPQSLTLSHGFWAPDSILHAYRAIAFPPWPCPCFGSLGHKPWRATGALNVLICFHVVSMVAVPVYHPTCTAQGVCFPCLCQHLLSSVFDGNCPPEWEVGFHSGFDVHFPDGHRHQSLSTSLLVICLSSLEMHQGSAPAILLAGYLSLLSKG